MPPKSPERARVAYQIPAEMVTKARITPAALSAMKRFESGGFGVYGFLV